MKKILVITSLVALSVVALNFVTVEIKPVERTNASSPATVEPCPKGSYSIGTNKNGDHICKLEPTGCPYGDSIPLGPDCDKHAPENQTKTEGKTNGNNSGVRDTRSTESQEKYSTCGGK